MRKIRTDFNLNYFEGAIVGSVILLKELPKTSNFRNYLVKCNVCNLQSEYTTSTIKIFYNITGCTNCFDIKTVEKERKCKTCGFIKSTNLFDYSSNKSKQWLNHTCKDCVQEKKNRFIKDNRQRIVQRKRFKKTGMTEEFYNILFKAQNGKCKICKTDNPGKKGLVIDHCHVTGRIRGLLCGNCNSAIGMLKDNLNNILSAYDYLLPFTCPICNDANCQSWRGFCVNTQTVRKYE